MTATPVARVCIDSPLPHLDRLFDYAVPHKWLDAVAVGSRVRVRFAGRLVNAVVVELVPTSDFEGKLTALNSVAASPSYTGEALDFALAVARRYGGSRWDVLRLMAPPRVASVEKRDWTTPDVDDAAYADAAAACADAAGAGGVLDVDARSDPRVVWEALPDPAAPQTVPAAALLSPSLDVAAGGRSALIVVPDARAIGALERVLADAGLTKWTARSGGHYAVLDHDAGPSQRYGSYLAAMHGHVRLVIGTRPTAMQPVPTLGLITVWDDGSDVYDEPHAPYPHARTVAAMRADVAECGAVFAAYAPSVDAVALVEHRWATSLTAQRTVVREATPTVEVLTQERREAQGGSGWHWMPGSVWRSLTSAVERGPVAVIVPRTGYVQALACARCGEWASCRECDGAVRQNGREADPVCVACGRVQEHWHCTECQSRHLKQVRQGVERITEQLRAMAPQWSVHVSTAAAGTLADFEVSEGLVVATPGALPAVRGGYAHAVIVGAQVPVAGALGAEVAAVRWWLNVAALVRSRRDGGAVTVAGELPDSASRALSTWSPYEAALADYRERAQLGLPPVRRTIHLTAAQDALTQVLATPWQNAPLSQASAVSVIKEPTGVTLLTTRSAAPALVDHLRALQQEWSAQGSHELRIRVDGPLQLS